MQSLSVDRSVLEGVLKLCLVVGRDVEAIQQGHVVSADDLDTLLDLQHDVYKQVSAILDPPDQN